MFWPEQLFMDTVFSAAVLGVVIVPGAGRGRSQPRRPGRSLQLRLPRAPEWYFLSLFQMLKLFPGSREVIGTIVIPTALAGRDVALAAPGPDLARASSPISWPAASCSRSSGGAGYLTVQAMQ